MLIDMVNGPPAPEAVIELLACKCSRASKPNCCSCIQNGLKCPDLCKLKTCTNWKSDEEAEDTEEPLESDCDDPDEEGEDEGIRCTVFHMI